MKSDILFYELFQSCPDVFFELMQITPHCAYRFESITVKTTEKRIDGVFEPIQAGQPIYFVEVQASPDPTIYQRVGRETATYFEQRPAMLKHEWFAMVLWLDKDNDDVGFGYATIYDSGGNQRIFAFDLVTVLKKLPRTSLAATVLSPFLVDTEQEVRHNLTHWLAQIQQTANLNLEVQHRLADVLMQLIEQKFKTLSYKELAKMLRLTPFRETISYRETFEEDAHALLVGKLVNYFKRRFHLADSTTAKLRLRLVKLTLPDLDVLFEDMADMNRLRELNKWIDDRLIVSEILADLPLAA